MTIHIPDLHYQTDATRVGQMPANVPPLLANGIRNYVERGLRCGSFLNAVLENDLCLAVARADGQSRACLCDLVWWLIDNVPSDCWGNREKVAAWIKRHERIRTAEELP